MLLVSCAAAPAFADTFYFSAPPKFEQTESRAIYEPLLAFLGDETGESFEYIHPGTWFAYQNNVRSGRVHLLLDDAHFAAWRIEVLGHEPLVRARERLRFVVVALKSGRIYSKDDLVAQPVCAPPPPALDTVGFLRHFDGPFRVPRIVATPDPIDRVQAVLAGDCLGAVLARSRYTASGDMRNVAEQLNIIAQTDAFPGLTLTARADVPETLKNIIRQVLLSRAGGEATRYLRDRLANGSNLVPAHREEYQGLSELVIDYPGFGR